MRKVVFPWPPRSLLKSRHVPDVCIAGNLVYPLEKPGSHQTLEHVCGDAGLVLQVRRLRRFLILFCRPREDSPKRSHRFMRPRVATGLCLLSIEVIKELLTKLAQALGYFLRLVSAGNHVRPPRTFPI